MDSVTSADGTVIGYTRHGDGPRVVRGLLQGSVPAVEIRCVLFSSLLLVAVFSPITIVLFRNKK